MYTMNEWLENYKAGKFDNKNVATQCDAGWYDWFCRDTSLAQKTKSLAPKVRKLSKSPKINPDRVGILFKNNCPLYGKLYDDIRLVDIELGEVVCTIIPSCGHEKTQGRSEVWGQENDFNSPLMTGTWSEVLEWFGVK